MSKMRTASRLKGSVDPKTQSKMLALRKVVDVPTSSEKTTASKSKDRRRSHAAPFVHAPVPFGAKALERMKSELEAQEYLAKLWQQRPVARFTPTTGMIVGEQSKYVTWDLNEVKGDTVEILLITDVQFGHVCCRYDRVEEFRDWIKAEPNRFMFWGGDMVDAWALHSPGVPWDQIGPPDYQTKRFVEIWIPVADRIIGDVGGNHERRPFGAFGDLGTLLATFLGCPYSSGKQLIDIHFGAHRPFTSTLWHGVGGAKTDGAIANVLARFMEQGDSQFFGMGHLHRSLVLTKWREIRAPGRRIRLQKKIGAIGTSFLETWHSYGEVAGFAAHDVIMPRIVLHRDGSWEVTLK